LKQGACKRYGSNWIYPCTVPTTVDDAAPDGAVKTIFVVELEAARGVMTAPPTVTTARDTFAGNPTPAIATDMPPLGFAGTAVVEIVSGYVTVAAAVDKGRRRDMHLFLRLT
jgi:hypothetical protein